MRIPFTNVAARVADEKPLILELIANAAKSGDFILRSNVGQFERAIASLTGARHAIAVASGTDGIRLSLAGLGVKRGDEVIVPAFGYAAIPNAVLSLGAIPVFTDVSPLTGCLNVDSTIVNVGARTKAIVPAHTLSSHSDMELLCKFSANTGIPIVEDAAVCLGSSIQGRAAGTWGDYGVFSVYPIKPLGGIGEGGIVVTDDDELAHQVKMLRNHGQDQTRFLHHVCGYNSRMDEVHAGYLVEKIKSLKSAIERRTEIAGCYFTALKQLSVELEIPPVWNGEPSWYTFVVLSDRRDELATWINSSGIGSKASYVPILPRQPAFARGVELQEFPGAQSFAARNLAIPLYPELSVNDIERVINVIRSFFLGRPADT